MRGARVLVTGGCGFIGSHLCRELVARGAERVVALDSLRYGDLANLGAAQGGDGGGGCAIEVVRHTLGQDDPSVLTGLLRGIDYLFHLAAEKHNQSLDSPRVVLRANIEGTHDLLAAAADAGVRKVVFTSSLYAYGRLSGPPMREDELPRPTTVYGISKLAGEHLCAHFASKHGLLCDVLRYFFIYGPRQFAGMGYKSVILKNSEQLLDGAPLTVFGDGQQALDYVYVDDAVDATLRAMERPGGGETLNIASGTAVPVLELLQTLALVSGGSPELRYLPADWTAGTRRSGDPGRAAEVLGWRVKTPLSEGLRRTFEWQRSQREAAPKV